MSFITAEKVREIRLRGAKDLEIDGFTEKFKLVKISAEAAELLAEKQKELTEGKISGVALARFTLKHAVATPAGDLLTDEDVAALMSVLPLETVLKLAGAFTGSVTDQVAASGVKARAKKAKGS